MKLSTITLFSFLLFSFSYADEGKELFMEANCQKCHISDDEYIPKNNKINNTDTLKSWVTGCSDKFDIGWFPEEEDQVVQYINKIYYNFK